MGGTCRTHRQVRNSYKISVGRETRGDAGVTEE
jgi:hypothetical protein